MPTFDEDVVVNGNIHIDDRQNSAVHYGNRGLIGQATTFNPDNDRDGLWIEGSATGRESGGVFMNGNVVCLWSPGDNDLLRIYDEDSLDSPRFAIDRSGNVVLRDTAGNESIRLNNNTGEITIKDWSLTVPDYVFGDDYDLQGLDELRSYVAEHRHLPEVPSAADIEEDGINLGQLCMTLLKKVEELSLHAIQQQDRAEQLEERLAQVESRIEA